MKQTVVFLTFILFLVACGGSKEEAEKEKAVDAMMSEADSIEDVEKIDAMGEEIGDLKMELGGRKAELDSLLKEAEKDESQ